MNLGQLQQAFTSLEAHLAERLSDGTKVSIYLTGSAAAVLSGVLKREAADCDMVKVAPHVHSDEIEHATWDVSQELDLDPEWLNDKSFFFSDYLPNGWQARAVAVGEFGPLTLYSLSRGDLIATKAVGASRPDDDKHRVDFVAMNPTPNEIASALAAVRDNAERFGEDFSRSIAFLEEQLPHDEPGAGGS